MTSIYFVRHAQPDYSCSNDSIRPLTTEGMADSSLVVKALQDTVIDYVVCSPYIRSVDTIRVCAEQHGLKPDIDERLREREKGIGSNNYSMFKKRWADFDYHERGGESLRMVQERNIEALVEVLDKHQEQNILWGTHGTALSTILNYYDHTYNLDDFMRIINFMPYIIRLDFKDNKCVAKEEILIVEKPFKVENR